MKKVAILLITLFLTSSFASTGRELASSLHISASSKASIQWERVFKRTKKMKKYGIDKLSDADKDILKTYLIEHAADSDAPEAAGL